MPKPPEPGSGLEPSGGLTLNHLRPVPHPGRWLSAGVVALLAAMFIHGLVTNEKLRWDLVAFYLRYDLILKAVGWTLILTVAAMLIGIVLAVLTAVMRQSENPILRAVAYAYVWFFRGTPIYTQLVFWGLLPALYTHLSLGVPFGPEFFVFETRKIFTGAVCAIVGLGLNEGAYLSEIVRSGLNSVDPGQREAASALGMSNRRILRRVVMPQAMRVIVPPTGNETISMLKTTSLVTAVPVSLELTFVASQEGSRLFQPIPLLIVASIWYLVITTILMIGQHYLERYYGRGFEGDSSRGNRAHRGMSQRQQAILDSGTTKPAPMIEYTP
ncbi:amino acid ABC transporter permease [Actinomyces trachealis]|uniref:amino acid ABC transporter permease n=1 Tax=Actinomyces trachealis TaxID=2763540 RepID=UPI001F1C21E9|nr:amino acid ABC transporter permease [Actinomyces trachealis]